MTKQKLNCFNVLLKERKNVIDECQKKMERLSKMIYNNGIQIFLYCLKRSMIVGEFQFPIFVIEHVSECFFIDMVRIFRSIINIITELHAHRYEFIVS